MNRKLRIGILLNDYSIPAWKFRILKNISDSGFADFVVVILAGSAVSEKQNSPAAIILRLLGKTDRLLFKAKKDYNHKTDASDFLKDIPVLGNGNSAGGENVLRNQVDQIGRFNLDILLEFGIHDLEGRIGRISKYGIWSYSIDDKKSHGFWEVIKGAKVSESALFVLDETTGQKKAIFYSVEATCPYSMEVNRNHLFWRASLFIPRILGSIYKYGDDFFEKQTGRFPTVKDNYPVSPTSLNASINAVYRYFVTGIKTALKKIFYTDAFNWKLIYDINDRNSKLLPDFHNFKIMNSPDGIFWADPFVVASGDKYYFFVEEYLYRTNKAHISVLELDRNGDFKGSTKIIERTYHMSYPFIFKIGTAFYMIPESCRNKSIELYKCEDFPYKWNFERNLMEDLLAVDTTVYYHNNKWWLFTSIDQTDNISGTSTELFLYFTDDFHTGKWISHPQNPVISDVRQARSAGKIFMHEGKIYRPSQDCSGRYGKGFKLNEIVRLTENEYCEEISHIVEPVWDENLKGTHTYNFDKELIVADVYSFRKRLMG